MKKVYQTVVSKGNGNCMQAVLASLFDKELEEVPNFIELGKVWYQEILKFYFDHGYEHVTPFSVWKMDKKVVKQVLEFDGGIGGYFYGVVPSQTFKDGTTHAVIVDSDLNIVHDPNPNQLALKLKPEDVIQVDTVRKGWHISVEGRFVIDEEEEG